MQEPTIDIQPKIRDFLLSNTNLSLAVSVSNIPYCAHCFYAYDPASNAIYFKSKNTTKHIWQALLNNRVAGTIAPNNLKVNRIQGIQFQGIFSGCQSEHEVIATNTYYKKHPAALVMKGELWVIEPVYFKMTDNTLGFGRKLEWGSPF